MRRDDLALATMTLARDVAEERRIKRSLSVLDAKGIAMFVADGGSPDDFVTGLSALPHVTLVPADVRGLVSQVRRSLRRASAGGARHVLYSEPDTHEFFEDHLDRFLSRVPDASDIGVVVAARSAAAFTTFPSMQRATESAINGVSLRSTAAVHAG